MSLRYTNEGSLDVHLTEAMEYNLILWWYISTSRTFN